MTIHMFHDMYMQSKFGPDKRHPKMSTQFNSASKIARYGNDRLRRGGLWLTQNSRRPGLFETNKNRKMAKYHSAILASQSVDSVYKLRLK